MKFVENGLLYRGFRPVMWSPVEKTALADAEVEYHEKAVAHDLCEISAESRSARQELSCTRFIVIWTTTPWTIPGNRAIAFSPEISYGLYEVPTPPKARWRGGRKLAAGRHLAEQVAKHAKMMLSRVRTVADELEVAGGGASVAQPGL